MKTITTITTFAEQKLEVMSALEEMSTYNDAVLPLLEELDNFTPSQFVRFIKLLDVRLLIIPKNATADFWERRQSSIAKNIRSAIALISTK